MHKDKTNISQEEAQHRRQINGRTAGQQMRNGVVREVISPERNKTLGSKNDGVDGINSAWGGLQENMAGEIEGVVVPSLGSPS